MNTKVDPAELFSKYPHIAKKITSLWGTSNCRELLISLISDSRDGGRAGFSPEIAKIIFALLDKHDAMYPNFDTSAHIEVPFRATQLKKPVIKSSDSDGSSAIKYGIIIFIIIVAAFSYMAYQFLYVNKALDVL